MEAEEVWGSAPKLGIVCDGSHAEYVVVPAETLTVKPKSLSMAQAAAIGVPYITAWASLVSAAQIQAGETILIVCACGRGGSSSVVAQKSFSLIGEATSGVALFATVLLLSGKKLHIGSEVALNVALKNLAQPAAMWLLALLLGLTALHRREMILLGTVPTAEGQ